MNNVVYDSFSEWFLIAETASLTVLFAITVISFAVYFVEIQILFTSRNSTFKGPFYRLMFIGILVDMISAVNLFALQILPARQWLALFYFPNESWLGAIFYAISYGGRCVQGATASILSFCRVCAVCFPLFYQKLSYPKYTYTMQAIQLSGAVASVFLLLPREYKYVNENGGYYSAFVNNEFRKPFFNFVAVLEILFVLAIVVNNLVTYITYRFKLKKKVLSRRTSVAGSKYLDSREKQKKESSLDKMTAIVCSLELIYFAFVVYSLQINQTMNKRVFYFLYNILCVIYSTYSAWMLLLFSRPITVQFKQRFLRLSSKRSTRSISISVQGGSRENNNK
ncbi:Serpentine Receptor, class V [Caenorhabditis elegans]|uniref:Serpentine Receptor, class V n=1 Tax=Caenorhabditis elegans TaxID=6239 RepID=P91999_CAEEL|nr:Serpentine Receptor, class V [Caenorhabditis elegans]CAB03129.2 Serpentine Receptor, class V [Caenorhabditis elegans]|eukprot:NP_506327.2 Serpentine Receptor, class V [Caenorhabditis elegans]